MNHWLASSQAFPTQFPGFRSVEVLAAGDSTGTALLTLAISGVILVVVFAFVRHLKKLDRQDVEKLSAAASALGFTSRATASAADQSLMDNSHLANLGRRRSIMNNILERSTGAAGRDTIFNFTYTTSAGKNARWITQTVMQMQSPAMHLPQFLLQPVSGGAADARQTPPAGNVIDVGASSKFKESFVLRGTDEAGIRQLFTPAVIQECEQRPQLCMEASANGLLVYENGRRVKPEELERFVNEGTRLKSLFEARPAGESRTVA
jgi:hypothetical protein